MQDTPFRVFSAQSSWRWNICSFIYPTKYPAARCWALCRLRWKTDRAPALMSSQDNRGKASASQLGQYCSTSGDLLETWGVFLWSTPMGDLYGHLGMGASVLYNLCNEKRSQGPQDWWVYCQALMNMKDPCIITWIQDLTLLYIKAQSICCTVFMNFVER